MDVRGLQAWSPSKLSSLTDALGGVSDGSMVALGGMTLYRRPIRAVLELIRRGARDLTLLDFTAAYEGDLLVGAGCVSTVRTSFFGLDVLGMAPMYREAVASGSIILVPETEATIAYGLRATRARTDFLPARIWDGTEMFSERPDLKRIRSPYSDAEYTAIPALRPDVAIVHASKADAAGNAVLPAELAYDADFAAAAAFTIVTTEQVVDTAEIESHGADILGVWVDAVVHAPRGAWPTSCYPDYNGDLEYIADYIDACRAGRFQHHLESLVEAVA